mgnify:CR=1 FL=1
MVKIIGLESKVTLPILGSRRWVRSSGSKVTLGVIGFRVMGSDNGRASCNIQIRSGLLGGRSGSSVLGSSDGHLGYRCRYGGNRASSHYHLWDKSIRSCGGRFGLVGSGISDGSSGLVIPCNLGDASRVGREVGIVGGRVYR